MLLTKSNKVFALSIKINLFKVNTLLNLVKSTSLLKEVIKRFNKRDVSNSKSALIVINY